MHKNLEIRTVTKAELINRMTNGGAMQLVNVLDPNEYALGVIKGSIMIPLAELEARCAELDETLETVTYCAESRCDASVQAARILVAKGFAASAYEGGIAEWIEAKLPLEDNLKPAAKPDDMSEANA